MVIAFQIILMLIIVLFSLAVIAKTDSKDARLMFGSIVIAGIIALLISFIVL